MNKQKIIFDIDDTFSISDEVMAMTHEERQAEIAKLEAQTAQKQAKKTRIA